MADSPHSDPHPSGELDLLAEVEHQKILSEEQSLAGHTVLTTVFSEAWREWLGRFAAHSQIQVDALFAAALAEHAGRLGFHETPPDQRP